MPDFNQNLVPLMEPHPTLVVTGVNMALTYAFQVIFLAGMLFYLDWRLAWRP